MNEKRLHIICELMNNSYARARKAFTERNARDYQHLARLQSDLGADLLTLNVDGTQRIQVSSEEMIELVAQYDTRVIVMASERFVPGGTAQCLTASDAYHAAKEFVEMLSTKAGRKNEQIIIDTGLAQVGADTYGLINIGLEAMRLIRRDPDLK